jgi:hypothetical protein
MGLGSSLLCNARLLVCCVEQLEDTIALSRMRRALHLLGLKLAHMRSNMQTSRTSHSPSYFVGHVLRRQHEIGIQCLYPKLKKAHTCSKAERKAWMKANGQMSSKAYTSLHAIGSHSQLSVESGQATSVAEQSPSPTQEKVHTTAVPVNSPLRAIVPRPLSLTAVLSTTVLASNHTTEFRGGGSTSACPMDGCTGSGHRTGRFTQHHTLSTVRVFGRNLHSRMPLDPTHVRLKRTYV